MVEKWMLREVGGEGRFASITSYKIRSDKSRAEVAAAPKIKAIPLIPWGPDNPPPPDFGKAFSPPRREPSWLVRLIPRRHNVL